MSYKNILLLLFIIVCFILILEVGLRIFSYPVYGFEEGFFEQDEIRGYKLSPNFIGTHSIYNKISEVRTNLKGLRDDREYSYEKGNSTRILILGDSLTFGNGVDVEESYPEYLRELYKDENVEVINLAVPGYGINNEYLSFIEEGFKYNPDIILIEYVTNDWNTHQIVKRSDGKEAVNISHTLLVNKKGVIASPSKKISLHSIHLSLLFKFRSYSFIYSKSRLILNSIINKFWSKQGMPPAYWDVNSQEYQEAYDGYYSLLKQLQESTDARIVIFIGTFTDDFISEEEVKDIFNIDYDVSPLQTQESVKEIANKLDIEVIEVISKDETIFLEVDGHWNAKGNKMVADVIFKQLGKFINKKTYN